MLYVDYRQYVLRLCFLLIDIESLSPSSMYSLTSDGLLDLTSYKNCISAFYSSFSDKYSYFIVLLLFFSSYISFCFIVYLAFYMSLSLIMKSSISIDCRWYLLISNGNWQFYYKWWLLASEVWITWCCECIFPFLY